MYLIDTNVISEIRKGSKTNPGVNQFFAGVAQNDHKLYISVVTVGELRRGVDLLNHRGDFSQGKLLENWLNQLMQEYRHHVLPIDNEIALVWGKLRVPNPQHPLDKLIAATALIYDLTVVTRNVGDFAGTGIRVLNPFTD
ncbi:type II toxin-antitoxin system VapC family toxin [Methylomonas sp. BW4-1]|uniref:type II toxin-antitoxin system VapC family toxin n=1 Tax=Methylomonas sp. BW4-1 TaxID=3376685 RepID=UPI004041B402